MTALQARLVARAVPRVAPLHLAVFVAAGSVAFVALTDRPGTAMTRLRIVAAALAAVLAFVLDDDAADTLASVPTTRLIRRSLRVVVGVGVVVGGYLAATLVADARSGAGWMPAAFMVEFAALACVGLGAAACASGRTDDGLGGRVGALVSFLFFGSVHLPQRWWLPLTSRPEIPRLLLIGALGLALALWCSTEVRRPRS